MKLLFTFGFLFVALFGCQNTATQSKVKFEEPEREQCYRSCLGTYKGNVDGARNKCFCMASKFKEGRSCFGGHGS